VFARTPVERKPFYVDLAAPLLVRNLLRAVRLAQALPPAQAYVDIVEMSPAPDELWLTDTHGHHYTSEFRVVAVNERPAAGVAVTGESRRARTA